MPIPKPRAREKQKDFVSRCMGDSTMVAEHEETGKRAAVCYSSWKKAKKANIKANAAGHFYFPELKFNLAGHGRRETINEVEYAIYPVVLLVEGVHHGAIGDPVYYPASVIADSAPHWDGMPVPVQHPQEDGQYVMCDGDEVRDSWCIGHVGNINFAEGKLSGEVFIEVKLADEKHPGLLASLDYGSPMEVSTGLLALEDQTPGKWNDEDYAGIITEIIPDHLALLPGGTGACSFKDGCGIRANKESKMISLKRIKEAAPAFAVNELSHSGVYSLISAYVDTKDVRDNDGGLVKMHYVREVFDKYFIFVERSQEGVKMFKQDYSVDSNDKLVLGESITEVKEETRFVTVSVNNEGGSKMADKKPCCPEKVKALIANEHSAYTEKDETYLLALESDQLDKIVNSLEAIGAASTKKAEPEPKKPEVNTDTKAVTLADYLAAAPAEIRGVLNAGMQQLDKARSEAIAAIKANTKAAGMFTDAMLMGKDLAELQAIAALAKPEPQPEPSTGYFGMNGAPHTNPGSTEEVTPYVPRTLTCKKADA